MRKVHLNSLLRVFRVGSGEWVWLVESERLWCHPSGYRGQLTTNIHEEGIQEPVLLGSDGRVWDGHHRIVAAIALGLDTVPVEFSGEKDAL